jgi:putative FmdB family regulatory protein
MPIYEYRCEECGHEMEKLQKMSDPALTECPECKQDALKKVISAAGFRLKGSGWYETDFKSGKKKNVHDSGSKAPACGGGDCGNNS